MNKHVTYDELLAWFASNQTAPADYRIGSEHEKFIYHLDNLAPADYSMIATILQQMQVKTGGTPIIEAGNIIGVKVPSALSDISASITLEPGGQMELSGAPLQNLHQTCHEITEHINVMQEICAGLDLGMLSLGYLPMHQIDDIPHMPKKRYNIMRRWMQEQGSMGLQMMHMTTTVQVNLDYQNEADMAQKMRIGAVLQPFATALFASSPVVNGGLSDYQSMRAQIWQDTDNQRAGIPAIIFEDDFNYQKWLDYLLDIPAYFINRKDATGEMDYVEVADKSFASMLQEWQDGNSNAHPHPYAPLTLHDFITHTSMAFPDIRLKNIIEMRGADCSKSTLCGLPALWVGLLYDADNQAQLYDMLQQFTHQHIMDLRARVTVEGMNAMMGDKSLYEWGEMIIPMAKAGLQRRKFLDEQGRDESIFLKTLEDIISQRQTIADQLRASFMAHDGDMQKIYQAYSFNLGEKS